MTYLLDTNIVSLELKNNPIIKQKLKQFQSQEGLLSISCVTYFEVKRGLFAVNATKQLERFDNFFNRQDACSTGAKNMSIIQFSCVTAYQSSESLN
jgi:predicted nucleic acid-binding protein